MSECLVFTAPLDVRLRSKVDRLSKATQRSRTFVATQAIPPFASVNGWQIGEIEKGIAEADAGDFASDKEMQRTIRRLTRRSF